MNLIRSDRAAGPRGDLAEWLTADVREQLDRRLADVQRAWPLGNPAHPVARRARTPGLQPPLEEDGSLAALESALLALAERRSALLSRWPGTVVDADGSAKAPSRAGRLLVCELDMSIGGGEAEAVSRGLFDVDDRPPWDLWLVAFGRTRPAHPDQPIPCLVAWIPREWEPLARAGIEACPTGGLYWAED